MEMQYASFWLLSKSMWQAMGTRLMIPVCVFYRKLDGNHSHLFFFLLTECMQGPQIYPTDNTHTDACGKHNTSCFEPTSKKEKTCGYQMKANSEARRVDEKASEVKNFTKLQCGTSSHHGKMLGRSTQGKYIQD